MAGSGLVGVFGVALALALVLYTVLASAEDRATVRASLRAVEGYETHGRERELLDPLYRRALAPLVARLVDLGRRFTPNGYGEGVRTKLNTLGQGTADQLDRFLAVRVLTIVAAPVALVLTTVVFPLTGLASLAFGGFVALALVLGPDAILNRKVAERKQAVRSKLPDVLDLLTIGVEAGLGFEQALDRTIDSVPGALSEEFGRMLGEVQAGSSRSDAMRALDARVALPEVHSFVLAVLQADSFGVSIGRILRGQADEMRIRRKQTAQESAQKAPVKMLVPMVFCIFPSLFVVVLGPAVINIARSL